MDLREPPEKRLRAMLVQLKTIRVEELDYRDWHSVLGLTQHLVDDLIAIAAQPTRRSAPVAQDSLRRAVEFARRNRLPIPYAHEPRPDDEL